MQYYDHYHDPNTHLQLTRQREDELLRPAKRPEIRPGFLARLRALKGSENRDRCGGRSWAFLLGRSSLWVRRG